MPKRADEQAVIDARRHHETLAEIILSGILGDGLEGHGADAVGHAWRLAHEILDRGRKEYRDT